MQVTLPSLSPASQRRSLQQLLRACQQRAIETQTPQIASYSVPLPEVDPLQVLAHFSASQQQHFYWERPNSQQAIAAGGSVASLPHNSVTGLATTRLVEGDRQRFAVTNDFIQETLLNTWQGGASDLSGTRPIFCCGFTFFDCPHPSSPFPAATVFLPRWIVRQQADGCTATLSIRITDRTVIGGAVEELESLERQILTAASSGKILSLKRSFSLEIEPETGAEDAFQMSVKKALDEIQTGTLNKVVLARSLEARSVTPFSAIASLHNLRRRYPNCYVFALNNGSGQTFLGATPESLIQVHQGRVVMDALAGSAPRGESADSDADIGQGLFDSAKDRHEHQVVVDAIVGTLAKFGMSAAADAVPSLLKLSNIQHLHTRIGAQLPTTVAPLELVARLHPTPAVAGFPKRLACDRILEWESFQRGLYAAPIGWVSGDGDSEMAVAIRSALLEGNRAKLYAGAGIVEGSDPAREWAEVNLKLQPLLRSLV